MSDEKLNYNPFPLGQIPVELQRPELHILKAMGYTWGDNREVIDIFEKKLADFWGSKYAVTVDCCTHAVELSLMYLLHKKLINSGTIHKIPARTYVSIPMTLEKIGLKYSLEDIEWEGKYRIGETAVIDAAVTWEKGGYVADSLMCLSMQIKKFIPIGRGGAILTNDYEAYKTLKFLSYDGRDLSTPYTSKDHIKLNGRHYYMSVEDAARGIILMDQRNESRINYGCSGNYPDIRIWGG